MQKLRILSKVFAIERVLWQIRRLLSGIASCGSSAAIPRVNHPREGMASAWSEHVRIVLFERTVLYADEPSPIVGSDRRNRLREVALRIRPPYVKPLVAAPRKEQGSPGDRIGKAVA